MSADGGGYYPSPPPFPFNFHLLEVTIISAQDLFPVSRSMRTYSVGWVHPGQRLRTRLDAVGYTDPTWNDKFVFRVDDATLRSVTSAIHVDIYAARSRFLPGAGTLIGTARAILSTLRPSTATRFIALQIRRPASLRPQGILNIGVALIDAYVRSLPLYADLGASNISYHNLVTNAKPAKEAIKNVLPPHAEAAAVLDRSGSLAGLGEERVVLEKKLNKWRSEIPAMEDDWGREEEPAVGDEESLMKKKLRRPRTISCFNIAERYPDEMAEDSNFTTSNRSSGSHRYERLSSSSTPVK